MKGVTDVKTLPQFMNSVETILETYGGPIDAWEYTPTPHTLHSTPLHPTPYTLRLAPYTLHPTPYTLHHTP